MHRELLFLAAILLAVGAATPVQEPISAGNWRTHPLLGAPRTTFQDVEKLDRAKRLTAQHRKLGCDQLSLETESVALRDEAGTIRQYVVSFGGEDSAYRAAHYYDRAGRLRFLLVTGSAVNESLLELRLYFDEAGERLWENRRLVRGPGYTFLDPWPEEHVVRDAGKAFTALPPEGCEVVVPEP